MAGPGQIVAKRGLPTPRQARRFGAGRMSSLLAKPEHRSATMGARRSARDGFKRGQAMPDHNYFANLIWQIADLLRGPYRPPQYERVMLPMTVLRRFDCVLAPTKAAVGRPSEQVRDRYKGEALDRVRRAALIAAAVTGKVDVAPAA